MTEEAPEETKDRLDRFGWEVGDIIIIRRPDEEEREDK